MDFQIQIVKKPSAKLRAGLKKFSDENWGEHVDSNEEILLNFFAPFDIAVLAKDGNKKIGLIEIFLKKNAFLGKKNIYIGGIGGVVVSAQYRHKGVATKMLLKTLEILKKERTDAAMLCTDIERLGGLYKKVGFLEIGRPYFFLDKNKVLKMEKGGMAAKTNSESILNELLNSNKKIYVGVSNF